MKERISSLLVFRFPINLISEITFPKCCERSEKSLLPVPLDKLKDKIVAFLGPKKNRDPKKNKVIIRGDSGANYQTVVKVIDEVNADGVTRFNLAMVKGSNSQSQTADEEK